MSGPLDSLVRIRLLFVEKALADTARVASGVRRAHEILKGRRNNQALIERRLEEVSNRFQVPQDARWLASLLALDRRLDEDLTQVRQEVGRAESDWSGQRDDLSRSRGEFAGAQAKLLVAQNLNRRRRRAANRLRERRMEVSGIRTRCL